MPPSNSRSTRQAVLLPLPMRPITTTWTWESQIGDPGSNGGSKLFRAATVGAHSDSEPAVGGHEHACQAESHPVCLWCHSPHQPPGLQLALLTTTLSVLQLGPSTDHDFQAHQLGAVDCGASAPSCGAISHTGSTDGDTAPMVSGAALTGKTSDSEATSSDRRKFCSPSQIPLKPRRQLIVDQVLLPAALPFVAQALPTGHGVQV